MLWKFQITSTLKAYKLLDVVDGSYPCPEMYTRDSNGVVTTIRVHSMGHQRSSLDLYDKCNSVSFSLGTCHWSKICKRNGLPTEFYPFCLAMRTRNEPITFEELLVLMLAEEKSLKHNTDSSKESMHLAMLGTGPKPNTVTHTSPAVPFNPQSNRGGREWILPSKANIHQQSWLPWHSHPMLHLQTARILDIGATDHFTPDLANIQQAKEYNGNDGVTVGRVLYKVLNEAGLYPIYGDPFKSKSLTLPDISKSQECIFLGYATHSKGYLCFDPIHNKLLVSRHVIFDELTFPFSKSTQPDTSSTDITSPTNIWLSSLLYFTTCCQPSILGPHPSHNPHTSSNPSTPTPTPDSPKLVLIPATTPPPENVSTPATVPPQEPILILPSSNPFSSTIVSFNPVPISTNTHPMQTRLKSGISKPKRAYTSTSPNYLDVEPPSFTIASALTPWVAAMEDEYSALYKQGTRTLVPPAPSQNIVGCKWVYKIKRHADGSISRFKARLIAKGFHQQAGLDYDETFSLVIKPTIVKIILTLAAQFSWPLRQLDISNAFLHGFLKEDVYMAQPQGFIDQA
uniref:Uncharacterized protein n=1 Tax=Fagus sylvatica TaxID=28930 RepID=A0A2N9G141_FAGSY